MKIIAMIETLICCSVLYVLSYYFDNSEVDMCKYIFITTLISPILYGTFYLWHELYHDDKQYKMEETMKQNKIKHEKYFSSKIDKELENDNC